jgi:hypothetical protein
MNEIKTILEENLTYDAYMEDLYKKAPEAALRLAVFLAAKYPDESIEFARAAANRLVGLLGSRPAMTSVERRRIIGK